MSYYKVVKHIRDKYFSAVADYDTQTLYIPGVFVSPPVWLEILGCGLCVFDDLEHARQFIDGETDYHSDLEIWECEVQESARPIPFFGCGDKEEYEKYYKKASMYTLSTLWPTGTLFFMKVKLLRRL